MEGKYWTTIWMDSTLRAATDFRSTYSYLIDVDDLLIRDTLFGGMIRAFSYIYRSVDSVNSWHPVSDSVWLDQLEVWGFGYNQDQTVEDYYVIDVVAPGTILATSDAAQATGNARDSLISDPVFLKFVPQIVSFEYGLTYLSDDCSLGIDNDSGAPFWTIETKDDITQDWRPWTLDTIQKVRDSIFNATNDFADQDDTVWGRWMRVIEQFEMDTEKDGAGTNSYDTIFFNGFRIHYYRNIK